MDSMFNILAQLPLFRGVTHERLAAIVGMSKFHFLKYDPGEVIAEEKENCTHVKFVISGAVRITISSADKRFVLAQTLDAPDVISPDFLFGPSTLYPGTVTAIGHVSVLQVSKSDYMKILATDQIFMFNFLNYLSMNAQKSVEGVLAMTRGSIEERLAMWVVAMTQPTGKDIVITCRQRDMYSMYGVQRSAFYAALDRLVEKGVIEYQPGEIHIVDRRIMVDIMRNGI